MTASATDIKKKQHYSLMRRNFESIFRQTLIDADSKDEKLSACAIAIQVIIATSERVGNVESAKVGHLGVLFFEKKNITITSASTVFKYVGKSGVTHRKMPHMPHTVLVRLKTRLNRTTKRVFELRNGTQIDHKDINQYLEKFKVTSKDIRAYNANAMMNFELHSKPKPKTPKDRKTFFLAALKKVAEKIGHTPSVLRKYYLMPDVEDDFLTI
jgi:DNA topoisomerase-1